MKKFDLSFVIAKEHLSFRKFQSLHDLEERHGVDLGQTYNNKDAACSFVHYIAESQRQQFLSRLKSSCHFYSILMDGSVDKGRVENELFLIMFCTVDKETEEVRTEVRYWNVVVPRKADAGGLVECIDTATTTLGIENVLNMDDVLGVGELPILVGCGTDGAAVNIAEQNGMRGKIQKALPWVYWSWCFAHRLELACKDSFCSKLFHDIDDMLLRLYYLYDKSPKKCRELSDLIENLKEMFQYSDGGNFPVRSQGTRWIAHKRRALLRVTDRYGAYLCHLTALSEDKAIKSVDRHRLKGYLLKFREARVLIGTALYCDALKCVSILSESLQADDLDTVRGLRVIVKAHTSLQKLKSQSPEEWPTMKLVSNRLQDDGEAKIYQGTEVRKFSTAVLQSCQKQVLAELQTLDQNIRARLEWSDIGMLRSILLFLDTRLWNSISEEDRVMEITAALMLISEKFRIALQNKEAKLEQLGDEIEEVIEYAAMYLRIDSGCYRKIWYQLFTSDDCNSWKNVLLVAELLFTLPFSTAKVERTFSNLKAIKSERRSKLNCSTLHDLLEVNTEGPNFENFSAESAVDLWWNDSSRRASYSRQKKATTPAAETDDSLGLVLDDWDDWLGSNADS